MEDSSGFEQNEVPEHIIMFASPSMVGLGKNELAIEL